MFSHKWGEQKEEEEFPILFPRPDTRSIDLADVNNNKATTERVASLLPKVVPGRHWENRKINILAATLKNKSLCCNNRLM